MSVIYTEENGRYNIDCTNAVWSSDSIHSDYHDVGIHLKDIDFVIEGEEYLLLVEYKNANIQGACNPQSFHPDSENKVEAVAKKYYDSLHYLTLMGKEKPKYYIYILEYPNGDIATRKRIRNLLIKELPFSLQKKLKNGVKLIERIDVLSIDEWNSNPIYCKYPIKEVE